MSNNKKNKKHQSVDGKSTKGLVEYGYVAIRFLDNSFCFFINSFIEVNDDECCIYSKFLGHCKFPKHTVEKIHGDSILIWENNSLSIEGFKNVQQGSSG